MAKGKAATKAKAGKKAAAPSKEEVKRQAKAAKKAEVRAAGGRGWGCPSATQRRHHPDWGGSARMGALRPVWRAQQPMPGTLHMRAGRGRPDRRRMQRHARENSPDRAP